MKHFLLSKSLWLNAIAFVLFVLALPQFVSVIPESYLPIIGLVTAVLNGALRIFFVNPPLTTNVQAIQNP